MAYSLVTPSASALVSRTEAKAHLRLTTTDDDALIDLLIGAAIDFVAAEVGSPLVSQQWKMTAPTPVAGLTGVPVPPVVIGRRPASDDLVVRVERTRINSVDSVRVRASGNWVPWVSGWAWRDGSASAIIRPAIGSSWPTMDIDEEAVEVTFTAGWAADKVPGPLKIATLLTIGDLYAFSRRDATLRREIAEGVGSWEWDTTGTMRAAVQATIDRLVNPWRAPTF